MAGIAPYTPESWRKTKADKIRAMTDKGLAEFMAHNVGCDDCRFFATCCFTPLRDKRCTKKWLNWLREEDE